MVVPAVPTPAASDISPVGFSSTLKSITFRLGSDPSFIFVSTLLNIPKAFTLSIDLLNNNSFNGSPSSTINLFLITSSIV